MRLSLGSPRLLRPLGNFYVRLSSVSIADDGPKVKRRHCCWRRVPDSDCPRRYLGELCFGGDGNTLYHD